MRYWVWMRTGMIEVKEKPNGVPCYVAAPEPQSEMELGTGFKHALVKIDELMERIALLEAERDDARRIAAVCREECGMIEPFKGREHERTFPWETHAPPGFTTNLGTLKLKSSGTP